MLKVVFRNRFRIVNKKTGEVLRLNVKADKTGTYRFTEGFNSEADAKRHLDIYLQRFQGEYIIEPYSHSLKQEIQVASKDVSKLLEQGKVFSGKGLQFNTITPRSQDNKYKKGQYYGREVRFAESAFHSKGTTVNKSGTKKVKHKKAVCLPSYHNMSTIDFIVASIKKQLGTKLINRKEVHEYLRDRKFSWKQTKLITSKVYQ